MKRLLQFIEALIAASEAYYELHPAVKSVLGERYPLLGISLRAMSDGLANGVCDAIEEQKREASLVASKSKKGMK